MSQPAIALVTQTKPLESQRLREALLAEPIWNLYLSIQPYGCNCEHFGFKAPPAAPGKEVEHYPLCATGKWAILGDKLRAFGLDKLDSRKARRGALALRKPVKAASKKAAVKKSAKPAKKPAAKSAKKPAKPAKTAKRR